MQKSDIKEILKTTLALFLICLLAAGLLAGINKVTAPIISESDRQAEIQSRKEVFETAADFGDAVTLDDGTVYCEALSEAGEKIGYVFTTSTKGYSSTINLMCAISSETDEVLGVKILAIDDTPGLGMNTKEESWLAQFVGFAGIFNVVKNGAVNPGDVNAVTSATISSKAVTKAVNTAVEHYNEIKEGGTVNG